jgi:hypothetical protein
MTKTQELLELAERCEKATGDDASLDHDIWIAVGRPAEYLVRDLKLDPPDYTVSLDSAMTLVSKGWSVALHAHSDDQSRASVYSGNPAAHDFRYAATPALALCAASLRARGELS